MSHTNDSLVMSHGPNSFYISIFIYQQKKRSRSWRAGCHNGCTGYDSGVVRYWIVCWIGWHFVITLKQIWNKNDVIMLRNDVIMLKNDVIMLLYDVIMLIYGVIVIEYDVIIIFLIQFESDPWFSFSFYFYLHWMESLGDYPLTIFKNDLWFSLKNEIGLVENISWLVVMIIGWPDSTSSFSPI